MEYTKTEWKDLPDTSTPITASALNNIEDGVEYLFEHGLGVEINDNYSNSTTDGYSCNYVNNKVKDVYSTDEVKTNKVWIDGKPIYRTVISLPSSYTNTSHESRTITHNLGIETYTNVITGYLKYSGQVFPIPRIARDGNNIGVTAISENRIILDVATAITTYSNLILVLEYTKTTD